MGFKQAAALPAGGTIEVAAAEAAPAQADLRGPRQKRSDPRRAADRADPHHTAEAGVADRDGPGGTDRG